MRVRYVIALVAVIMIGWALRSAAQAVAVRPLVPPQIVSGNDIGFRIEGNRGGTPVGTIIVKVNGEWVAAEIGMAQPKRISQR